jgi:CheY-like chemotaxis protein
MDTTAASDLKPGEDRSFVLIVDDDPGIRRSYRRLLEACGFFVETAMDGRDALDLLGRLAPNLPFVIVLDVEMPVMDGPAFLAAIRQKPNLEQTPVVVSSGRDTSMARCTGHDVHPLPKPVFPDDLVSLLRWLNAGSRLEPPPGHGPSAATQHPLG